MKRRDTFKLLLGAAALASIKYETFAMQNKNDMIKPKRLKKGDTIGVVAPGSAADSPDDIYKAEEIASLLGVNLVFGKTFSDRDGIKTKSPEIRAEDINDMFSDDDIDGIFAIRGGYGTAQTLDLIDYKNIKKHPKVLVGYSDITALHNSINQKTGLITFHGPLLLSSFTEWTFEHFTNMLFNDAPVGNLTNPDKFAGVRKMFPLRTVTSGKAKGKITGGNLTIISSLMGTPYEIDTKDKILLIEDVGEAPYRIDRMLTQLRLAGKLQQAKGIIVGKCHGCEPDDSRGTWDYDLSQVIEEIIKPLDIPCYYGLMFGHTKDQLTLPMGLNAEMDADAMILTINESAVI